MHTRAHRSLTALLLEQPPPCWHLSYQGKHHDARTEVKAGRSRRRSFSRETEVPAAGEATHSGVQPASLGGRCVSRPSNSGTHGLDPTHKVCEAHPLLIPPETLGSRLVVAAERPFRQPHGPPPQCPGGRR